MRFFLWLETLYRKCELIWNNGTNAQFVAVEKLYTVVREKFVGKKFLLMVSTDEN